jgi:hypothetical protein
MFDGQKRTVNNIQSPSACRAVSASFPALSTGTDGPRESWAKKTKISKENINVNNIPLTCNVVPLLMFIVVFQIIDSCIDAVLKTPR